MFAQQIRNSIRLGVGPVLLHHVERQRGEERDIKLSVTTDTVVDVASHFKFNMKCALEALLVYDWEEIL